MVSIETLLRKCGFDTMGISKKSQFENAILSFNPDVFFAEGVGRNSSGLELSQELRGKKCKCVLFFHPGRKPDPKLLLKGRVDAALEIPFSPEEILRTVCKLMGTDEKPLLEKLKKMRGQGAIEAEGGLFAAPPEGFDKNPIATGDEATRVQKYSDMVAHIPRQESSELDKKAVMGAVKEYQRGWNWERLDKLQKDKQDFAQALILEAQAGKKSS